MPKKNLYIGIDLNNERAMISLYHEGMHEVQTVSAVPGEERYQIPTAVFVSDQGGYFYGHEALRRQNRQDGTFFNNLYEESLSGENVIYRNMLVQFIARLIKFKERYDFRNLIPFLAITIPDLGEKDVELFEFVRNELGFSVDHFQLMDYSESFFANTCHQDASIRIHDVALFNFVGEKITFLLLRMNAAGKVRRVVSEKKEWTVPEESRANAEAKDLFFAGVMKEAFDKRVISGVYFIGDGFDGKWMKETLRCVGPNKRVFLGKNLFTQGACLAAFRSEVTDGWNYYYDCPYKIQGELQIKLLKDGEPYTLRLTSLGENWFRPTEKYYLLYDGDPRLEIMVRTRERIHARTETFTLDYLPEREPKSIRLSVQAVPLSGNKIEIRVADDGFGELFDSSGKTWCFPVTIIPE